MLHSRPLFDRDGWYRRLQADANRPYPRGLKRAIIARNHPVLRQTISSYRWQIEQAVRRDDAVSVQHRVAALLASYFDIIFAVIELPHPGEKRLLEHVKTRRGKAPPEMEQQVNALLAIAAAPSSTAILTAVDLLLDGLDTFLVNGRSIASASDRTTLNAGKVQSGR